MAGFSFDFSDAFSRGIAVQGTFDLTFDRTFSLIRLAPVQPGQSGCKKPGALLAWLTLDGGYMYWLFDGTITTEKLVGSKGGRIMAGSYVHNQKVTGQVLTVRAGRLSEAEARAVATIYESSDVNLMVPDDDGIFHQVPVSLEPNTFLTWESKQGRGTLDARIFLPTRNTQRT